MATNLFGLGFQDFYSSTLTADITSVSTSIGLSTLPTPSMGILVIDPDSATSREIILYTSKSPTVVNLPADGRGYSGTTAAAHLTGTTVIMAPVKVWFDSLVSGEISNDSTRNNLPTDHVVSGCVWTADAAGSTRNASMTAGVIYLNGHSYTVDAVTARNFVASKDTYIDLGASGLSDGKATPTYTASTNNAASPAVGVGNMRIGIIVTGASSIATAQSINQGQESSVLPIASSIAYSVTDSLGNVICQRGPYRRILGYHQITSPFTTTTGGSQVTVTGLSTTVNIPTTLAGRKVRLTFHAYRLFSSQAAGLGVDAIITDTTAGVNLASSQFTTPVTNYSETCDVSIIYTLPATGTRTFNVQVDQVTGGATLTVTAASDSPAYLLIELM
jgi:hypothetical protein